ncbi:BTB/POZ domain-containing protein kctd1 [Desmophyllum pertusum]|uniref:BTB/POZ domain-containing protein kctd1 n=1 Tax=Desmophyllum pertusum TaxID=174260 RepID=A0A9W9Z8U5_9CNID|nr:BTB/POZ domain-containing protein kctd1 [Desmophyllum pertusum]
MAKSVSRFAKVSEVDLERLVDDKDAKNTKRATKTALTVLQQYLKEKKLSEPQTKDGISNVLKLFYVEARKLDGTPYSRSSLNSLRFGLGRYFKATLGFDIINDPAFPVQNYYRTVYGYAGDGCDDEINEGVDDELSQIDEILHNNFDEDEEDFIFVGRNGVGYFDEYVEEESDVDEGFCEESDSGEEDDF